MKSLQSIKTNEDQPYYIRDTGLVLELTGRIESASLYDALYQARFKVEELEADGYTGPKVVKLTLSIEITEEV